ncbi:MAG: hypothetical protein VYB46_05530, partial [Pseudomonadota bacterium]|nr:hypothetical protein [Pseudomonadota bacterium]
VERGRDRCIDGVQKNAGVFGEGYRSEDERADNDLPRPGDDARKSVMERDVELRQRSLRVRSAPPRC